MKKASIVAAERELTSTRKSLEALRTAMEIKDVHRLWSDFLIHANRVFSKLEQGAKATHSQPWYGKIIHQRRSDPLLIYIHQARDAVEHGDVLLGNDVVLRGIEATVSHFYTHDAMVSGGPAAGSSFSPRRLIVLPATTRSGTYLPPRNHLGKPIHPSLENIVELVVAYLDRLIIDAKSRMISD